MPRIDVTDESLVLTALLVRLRTALTLSESRCFAALDRHSPGNPVGGDYYLTVSPGPSGSSFDDALGDGGGLNQVTEHTSYTVAGYTRIKLDHTDTDISILTNSTRGLLKIKRHILGALCYHDLQISGSEFLRNQLMPISAEQPQLLEPTGKAPDALWGVGMVSVTFAVAFDWNLS